MKKHAFILGLTAVLYTFVFLWLAVEINSLLNFAVPHLALTLAMLAASYVSALKLAPLIEGSDEPPASLIVLLLFAAGYYLFMQLLGAFGVGFGYGKFGRFAGDLTRWALIGSAVLSTRFMSHRVMLFVGITVMAMQFQAALALGLLSIRIPKWILQLISFAVAVWIARWFCVGDESPADRVKNPVILWLFSAAAVLAAIFSMDQFLFRSWLVILVWSAFLVSFVMLVSSIEPDDPTHAPSALGADYGRMLLVLIALFALVGGVFHVSSMASAKMSLSAGEGLRNWAPFLVTLAVSIGIMVYLQLGTRVRTEGPGRRMVFWGVVLFFIGVLAGGSIFGAVSDGGKMFEFLAAIFLIGLLVAPIMVLAQILMGVGLLRILFTLDPPRRD